MGALGMIIVGIFVSLGDVVAIGVFFIFVRAGG